MERYMFSKLYYLDKQFRNYLIQLLGKFTNRLPKNDIKQVYHMIKNRKSDEDIVNYLLQHFPINIKKVLDSTKRANRISGIWYRFLLETGIDLKPKRYLDIGCNNGTITVAFGNRFGLNAEQIYGIDVDVFTEQRITPVPGFIYQSYNGYQIPYPNNYFDLITCSMVLHHVEKTDILLDEIYRVLDTKGFFFIKEHDAYSIHIKWLIYLEHLLYDIIEYRVSYSDFVQNYEQFTFSKKELNEIITNHGFVLIKTADQSFIKHHHIFNPTKTYYSLYQKV